MYNCMGIILEAHVFFSSFFVAFMHYFQILVSDFGDFQTLYGGRKSIEKALHANECVR